MTQSDSVDGNTGGLPDGLPFPNPRPVSNSAPFGWLRKGIADLIACPIPSLFYGFCFAAAGLLVTMVFARAVEYTLAMTSGFLLVAPLLAMGLYEISRRRQHGESCLLFPTLTVWRRNASNIGVFAIVLGIIFLIWARVSMVIFALFFTNEMPSLSGFMSQLFRLENIEFVLVYLGVGLFFALLAFGISIVSIPLMLDRNQDAISSMLSSVRVLFHNPLPMLIWAVLITLLTIVGFLTFHLGLVVVMPVLGHATWHAYRDLVEPLQTSKSSTTG